MAHMIIYQKKRVRWPGTNIAWSNTYKLISILHLHWNAFGHWIHWIKTRLSTKMVCTFISYCNNFYQWQISKHIQLSESKMNFKKIVLCVGRFAVGLIRSFFKLSSSFLQSILGKHLLSSTKTDWFLLLVLCTTGFCWKLVLTCSVFSPNCVCPWNQPIVYKYFGLKYIHLFFQFNEKFQPSWFIDRPSCSLHSSAHW